MNYDCLENLFGITQSDCSCVVDGLVDVDLGVDWYKLSTSNLFLDDLEGIVPLKAADASTECENEMATFYYNARRNAIQTLGDEMVAGLTLKFTKAQRKYTGAIGGTVASSISAISSVYQGMKLSTVAMRGASIKINKITTMMNADATFNIEVYKVEEDSDEYELVATIPNIFSLASGKKVNTLATPVVLYLSEDGADFYLLYQPSGFLPKQNAIKASCCGSKQSILGSYLTVAGTYGDDLSMLSSFRNPQNAMGLSLDAEVGCDTSTIVCASFEEDERMAKVMAYAGRYKAGELVHEFVLGTNNINQYTMASRENLYGKRNHFKKEYTDRLSWLIENTDMNLIGCYACNTKRLSKGGILV